MTTQNKSKYLDGGWLLLIKAIATVVIVFIVEQLTHLFIKNDPLGQALIPFHNNYFSFPGYYLTTPGLSSEFSYSPSATFRFVAYALFGYIIYAVLSISCSLFFKGETLRRKINSGLFYAFLLCAFLLAFAFPDRKSTVNETEINCTEYHYWFLPSTQRIPFSEIQNADYQYISDYDGYNKRYVYSILIFIQTIDGRKTALGQLEVNAEKGTLKNKPETVISPGVKAMAEQVVELLNEKISTGASL